MPHRDLARRALIGVFAVATIGLLSGAALGAPGGTQTDSRPASPQIRARSYQIQARFFQAEALLRQNHRGPAKVRKERTVPRPALIARILTPLPITTDPGKGTVIGTMPAASRYLGQPLTAWIQQTTPSGRFGKVTVPFTGTSSSGWIRLDGLELAHTPYSVRVDRSSHLLTVMRWGKVMMTFPTATGAPASPTPTGRYFVTDRVAIPSGGPFGTYAFGLSGLQPNLPVGWSGGDQLAIHGTDNPSSIGTSSSAGCLHVGEIALQHLEPLLRPGTPVTIKP
jgi:lipoprotein-anchoring transpeptidase ErfK/SrfK